VQPSAPQIEKRVADAKQTRRKSHAAETGQLYYSFSAPLARKLRKTGTGIIHSYDAHGQVRCKNWPEMTALNRHCEQNPWEAATGTRNRSKRNYPTHFAIGILALVAAARAQANASPVVLGGDRPAEIKIVSTEFKYSPARVLVPSGHAVTIILDNSRAETEHSIVVPALGFRVEAEAGEIARKTAVFDKPGEFEFGCDLPARSGHERFIDRRPGQFSGPLGRRPMLRCHDVKPLLERAKQRILCTAVPAVAGALLFASGGFAEEQPAAPADGAALPALPVDLGRVPSPEVAPPVNRTKPKLVRVVLEAKPVTGLLADGVGYQYWTYNGTVPGPMIRVRQGTRSNSP
jgi:plastocyanin